MLRRVAGSKGVQSRRATREDDYTVAHEWNERDQNMAKKVTGKATKGKKIASKVASRIVKKVTEIRNSSIPPKAIVTTSSAPRTVSHDQIARRAYEIYASGKGGTDIDNWLKAERDLRAGR
jgi:hypothetical protein